MRDGVIQQLASPDEIYHRAANLFMAGLIGAPAMNVIEGRIATHGAAARFLSNELVNDLTGYTFRSAAADGPTTLGFCPDHLLLDGAASGLPPLTGRIAVVEPMGSEAVLWSD